MAVVKKGLSALAGARVGGGVCKAPTQRKGSLAKPAQQAGRKKPCRARGAKLKPDFACACHAINLTLEETFTFVLQHQIV